MIFEKLKKAHPTFTRMQLRIWAEMVQSGMYPSLEPPNTSMFHRAGGSTATKQKEPKDQTQALTDAATAIASTLCKPVSTAVSPVSAGSPARIIEQRSKLYKHLYKTGILSEQEYHTEKQSIVSLLQQLRAK